MQNARWKFIYRLLWSEWFYILNESLITEHKTIFIPFHLQPFFMILVSQSLYKHHFSFAPTIWGAQDKVPSKAAVKTDEPWMLRSGCCSPVGHEPSSISITSFIWQTHQRQETTPCLCPFNHGQEYKKLGRICKQMSRRIELICPAAPGAKEVYSLRHATTPDN